MTTFRDALRDAARQDHVTGLYAKAITKIAMPTNASPATVIGALVSNLVSAIKVSAPPTEWVDAGAEVTALIQRALRTQ